MGNDKINNSIEHFTLADYNINNYDINTLKSVLKMDFLKPILSTSGT
jgi:hypothetical protein